MTTPLISFVPSLFSLIALQSFDFDSIDSISIQRWISFATRLCESTAGGKVEAAVLSYPIIYICYSTISAWKKNRVLACALRCVVNMYFHYIYISIRAWRTCIRDFHLRKPLTFDFLLCASHLFCWNHRWPTRPTLGIALISYHLRNHR